MPESRKILHWQRSVTLLAHVGLIVAALAALYLLKEVLIPLALALFLSFLLYPFVKWQQRCGVPRKLAVMTIALATLLVFSGGCWVISAQLSNLATELPDYTRNITQKLNTMNQMTTGSGRWRELTEEITRVINGKGDVPQTKVGPSNPAPQESTMVVVKEDRPRWMIWMSGNAGAVLSFIGELALSLVLVIFILMHREDLLNRVLRLAGQKRVSLTSKAVSETSARISRFLFVQFVVNSMFGILLAVSLLVLGLNYALLWGFLTAVLRYLPYIGPWIAAICPLALSLAQFDGWWQPLVILSIYLALEIIISNFVEPYLYGQSIGVSPVALLLAAAFWGWMWGFVGLVLSAPLTVVLVVLGKYVSGLHYLTILFSDEPALSKEMSLYQRLLAGDADEADRQVKERLNQPEPERIYDEMLAPSLTFLKVDYQRRVIDQDDVKDVQALMGELIEVLSDEPTIGAIDDLDHPLPAKGRIPILAYAVRDSSDYLAMTMLGKMLDRSKWNYELAPANALSSEIVAILKEHEYLALCLGTVQPGGTLHLRHLCKKIRLQFPEIKILVGVWGTDKISEEKVHILSDNGADWVGNTLQGASDSLAAWYPVWNTQTAKQVA